MAIITYHRPIIRKPNLVQAHRIHMEMARMWWAEMPLNEETRCEAMRGATMRVFDYWRTLFFRDMTLSDILGKLA